MRSPMSKYGTKGTNHSNSNPLGNFGCASTCFAFSRLYSGTGRSLPSPFRASRFSGLIQLPQTLPTPWVSCRDQEVPVEGQADRLTHALVVEWAVGLVVARGTSGTRRS